MKKLSRYSRQLFALLVVFQLVMAVLLCIMIHRRDASPVEIEAPWDHWYSHYKTVDPAEGCLRFSPQELPEEAEREWDGYTTVFFEKLGTLEPGSYTVTIDYSADSCQKIGMTTDYAPFLKGGTGLLPADQHSVTADFLLTEAPDELYLNIRFDGRGELELDRIVIRPSSARFRRLLFWALLLSLGMDLAWLGRKKLYVHRETLLYLTGIVLLASLPMTTKWLENGHDLVYHLIRIESVAEGLKHGQLLPRIASCFSGGAGYASPIFYCDLFLLFPALLRLFSFTVMDAYKGYVILVNAGTALISYGCFSRIGKDKKIGMAASLLWTTFAYRYTCILQRASVGEYSAFTFLPLLALAVWQMYVEKDKQECVAENTLWMSLGMCGIIFTHTLTSGIVAAFFVILCIIGWRTTFRAPVLKTWICSVLLTAVLGGWYLIPFMENYFTVPVLVNQGGTSNMEHIQEMGATITDLMNVFCNMMSSGRRTLLLTPGIPLLASLLWAIRSIVVGKSEKSLRVLTACSLLLLWMSTDVFPWDFIILHIPVLGETVATVQFAFRYLGSSSLMLTLLFVVLTRHTTGEKRKKVLALFTAASVLMGVYYSGCYAVYSGASYFTSGADLDTYFIESGEFNRVLSPDTDPSTLPGVEEAGAMRMTDDSGTTVWVPAAGLSETVIPVYYYPGYTVTDAAGTVYPVRDSRECMIAVSLPEETPEALYVSFREPWYWTAGSVCSVISWLVLGFLIAKRKTLLR